MSASTIQRWPHLWHEKLLFGFLYALAWIQLRLPLKVHLVLGAAFGEVMYALAGKRREVVLENLKKAYPDSSDEKRVQMMRGHFRHLGRLVLEYFWFAALTKKDIDERFVFHGLENFDEALKKGKGAFILGSHIGSGDLGIIATHLQGYPMHLIGRRTKVQWATRMLFGLREIHGVEALPEENVMLKVFKALKKNEIVIFVLDQFQGPPSGTETKFFGHDTGTAMGLSIFAEKTNAPIVPVSSYRDEDGRIHVVVEKELPLEKLATRDETYRHMTQKFNDEIERVVRLHPEQWFWVHRRFKNFVRH